MCIRDRGKSGQILKGDLISLMGSTPQPSERKLKYGEEERIKMSRLRETIAKNFNLDSSRVILGAGSDQILELVCNAFLEKNEELHYESSYL